MSVPFPVPKMNNDSYFEAENRHIDFNEAMFSANDRHLIIETKEEKKV